MIKAILLIFEPWATWEKIASKIRGGLGLMIFLVPVVLFSVGVETAGIFYWGKKMDFLEPVKIPRKILMNYAVVQGLLSFVIVFISAYLLKAVTETFRSRNTFARALTVMVYGLSPWFLVRLLDAIPAMNPWATFGVGITLSITTLYYGIPKVMELDPAHAFGVYFMTSLLVAGISSLERFVTLLILSGKVKMLAVAGCNWLFAGG